MYTFFLVQMSLFEIHPDIEGYNVAQSLVLHSHLLLLLLHGQCLFIISSPWWVLGVSGQPRERLWK